MNITVVQKVSTFWTKKSRGNPGASLRNSVPVVFPMTSALDTEGIQYHWIEYTEHNDFQSPTVRDYGIINENRQREIGFQFEVSDGELDVSKWEGKNKAKHIGRLSPKSWLQTVSNSRSSCMDSGNWYYHKYVHNIYFGPSLSAQETLNLCKPTIIYNKEIDLW